MFEIKYRLIAKTPIFSPQIGSWEQNGNSILCIPGISLQGAARQLFMSKDSVLIGNESWDKARQLFFGRTERNDTEHLPHIFFSDAICKNPGSSNQITSVSINRNRSSKDLELATRTAVSVGTEFIGKVTFTKEPNGIERSIALSAIIDLPRWGAQKSHGYGQLDIEILERTSVVVFISYSWESEEHKDWVRRLALQLIDKGFTVLLDQLSPTFNLNKSQDEINHWMIKCVNNSDKVIAVLTPNYRYKAENGLGGVGYEYKCLLAEKGMISEKLERYIGALRSGDFSESLPRFLENRPVFDMREYLIENSEFSSLIKKIKSS